MYFHTDLNGCPEELTDENGEILWECSFQLWGKRVNTPLKTHKAFSLKSLYVV
ncbi:RHS domain-containing protein [Gilliamella sp. Occ4-3]|uniref:RHS domain-containing protein n=1 Tax=Gilliamella sp. Occ4-3 TaxID=3120254 RepID=UPI003FA53F75